MLIDSIIGEKSTILVKQNIGNVFSTNNMTPIENITVATWQCPMDYEPIYEGKYFDSEQGCYVNSTQEYFKGSCDDNHVHHGEGREIPAIENLPIKLWRNNLICMKRYLNPFSVLGSSEKTCPEGYGYCGKVDVYGNFMCVLIKYECPVTSIIISKEIYGSYYSYYWLGGKVRISFTRKKVDSDIIPMNFFMALDIPCLLKGYISNTTPPFSLIHSSQKSKFGCTPEGFTIDQLKKYDKNITDIDLRDKRYSVLDTINYFQFLKENDIYDDVSEVYKEFFDKYNMSNSNITLFKKGNTSQNYTCLSKEKSNTINQELLSSKGFQFKLLLMELVNITVLSLFVSLLALVKSKKQFDLFHICMSYLKILLSTIFITFNFIMILTGYKESDNLVDLIKFASENRCFETSTIFAFEVYNIEKNLKQTRRYNEFLFWGSCIYAFIVFVQIIHTTLKTLEKVKNKSKMTTDAKAALKAHLNEK
jgi:hypothetical protein